jgi:peroxiredoxin
MTEQLPEVAAPATDAAAPAAGKPRGSPRAAIFWALIVLSVVTIGAGARLLWQQRQEIAEESRPAATGPTRSLAPDFKLTGLDGRSVRLSDYRGKVVLLNFWATWCPPCKAEMPDLDQLHRTYAEKQNFAVVGIDLEESAADVAAFAGQQGVSFPLLLDSDGEVTTHAFSVRNLPTSMIIDRDGYIRDAWMGQIAPEAMVARLKRVW